MCFAPQRRALLRHFFHIGTSKSGPRPSVFYTFDLEMCFAPQRRALFRHRNFQKSSDTEVFSTFSLRNVLRATTACTFSTSQPPKVVRTPGVLYILTSKCASRHNGVHFCDTFSTSEPPKVVRDRQFFYTFDLEMCFAPQRRALFSTSQLPKVVRHWGVFYIFTSKCASRHNGVQFFISHLASWLRTRRFSEPTFRLSGATNHWKNTVFRDFPTFSRICIFFLLTLSLLIFSLLIFLFSLPLPCSAFHLSILSEVWLLNFLRLYIALKILSTHQKYCLGWLPCTSSPWYFFPSLSFLQQSILSMSSGPHAHLKVVYFQLDSAASRFARANCYRQQHFLLPKAIGEVKRHTCSYL